MSTTVELSLDMACQPHQLPIKVFLVEDSARIRESLTDTISTPGRVEVVGFAETERDAVDALESASFDVVLIDLHLRQGNGFGVLRALANSAPLATKIVMTNYDLDAYRQQSHLLGVDYFFDKSREYARVVEVLDALADGAEQPAPI